MEQLQLFEEKFLVWRLDRLEQDELMKALNHFQVRFNGREPGTILCREQQINQLRDTLQFPAGVELKGRTMIQPDHIWLS